MGLDMYAYVGVRGQREAFFEQPDLELEVDKESGKSLWISSGSITEPRKLAYWRKHPNLHGWMKRLWESKGCPEGTPGDSFNGIELELVWEDIEKLEEDIKSGAVADLGTTGFFFGNPSDDHYRAQDLAFIRNAKAELFCGLKVFYNSSW